jgi:hypothetical protein
MRGCCKSYDETESRWRVQLLSVLFCAFSAKRAAHRAHRRAAEKIACCAALAYNGNQSGACGAFERAASHKKAEREKKTE